MKAEGRQDRLYRRARRVQLRQVHLLSSTGRAESGKAEVLGFATEPGGSRGVHVVKRPGSTRRGPADGSRDLFRTTNGLEFPRLSYVIGIDGGSTKTDAVVADLEGRPLGAGRSGCANWEIVGEGAAADAIHDAIRRAVDERKSSLRKARHVHIGAAGVRDWPEDESRLRSALDPFLGEVPLSLENDSFLGVPAPARRLLKESPCRRDRVFARRI